jgi:hypothetical protein
MVGVAQNPKPYFTVFSETPSTWRARFPYLRVYPQEQGGPIVPPGTQDIRLCNHELFLFILFIASLQFNYGTVVITNCGNCGVPPVACE